MIVEDGSVVNGANSYVTLEYANDYHTARGNSGWTGSDAVKSAAIIRATDYLEQVYYNKWVGLYVEYNQPLAWPRSGVIDLMVNVIPEQLKQATALLALEALTDDLLAPIDRAIKREKVDVIEVEYSDTASSLRGRPAVEGLLRRWLRGGTMNAKTVRV